MLLALHPLQPIVSTPSSASSLALHCYIWESYAISKRGALRGAPALRASCSNQGQDRVPLCQIQLRLYHGLLIPEGHQAGVQKKELAPMAGKSDIVLSDPQRLRFSACLANTSEVCSTSKCTSVTDGQGAAQVSIAKYQQSGINTTSQLLGAKLCSPKHRCDFCLPQRISPSLIVISSSASSRKF